MVRVFRWMCCFGICVGCLISAFGIYYIRASELTHDMRHGPTHDYGSHWLNLGGGILIGSYLVSVLIGEVADRWG